VVTVHDGRVIAERYADGIGVDTPLMGFSIPNRWSTRWSVS
jgi:hypothetical protein